LLDSGADIECLLSDIVTVKLWEKCATLAKGVDGNPLDTSLLVRDIHVCKDNLDLCIAFDFVLLNYFHHEVLRGIPFLSEITPFYTFSHGIRGRGQKVFFQFISAPISSRMKARSRPIRSLKDPLHYSGSSGSSNGGR
jgi:hypothetical protein